MSTPERLTEHAGGFQDLMRHQVRNVLFVSSLYESFIMAEDGQLNELLLTKFLDLNLSQAPNLTHVSTAAEALAVLHADPDYQLIISALHVGDMDALALARRTRLSGFDIPVVLLAYDYAALKEFLGRRDISAIEQSFLWQGDARILLAIVKSVEDRINVSQDAKRGVPVFIVVEDNIRNYSSFLPVIYEEVMKHSQRVTSEGVNLSQRILRLRARPKILLATDFEQAWGYFSAYPDDVLGVISDVEFPRDGVPDPGAGIELATRIRAAKPDIPIALHSSHPENEQLAMSIGAAFLAKRSPDMLHQLREQLTGYFAFGDFVFRMPDGSEIGRAQDLESLREKIAEVPPESVALHAERNHFSRWLRVRAEFDLAQRLRPQRLEDYAGIEHLRHDLLRSIEEYRRERDRGTVADFQPRAFEATEGVARIGRGSLGGKARGLAFAVRLIDRFGLAQRFPGVRICVPPAVVLGTNVFVQFLQQNGLRDQALAIEDDAERERLFLSAHLPEATRADLARLLEVMRDPLAVRSSSLLEDSPYQPFAGIFATKMLPNVDPDPAKRLQHLESAIKQVYASAFSLGARRLLEATPYRLEEDAMAVVVQRMVGARHGDIFYPDFAGVARSHNFYPKPPATAEDGVAAIALGLGRTVVDGQSCVRFSPAYPQHLVDLSTVEDMLENSQRHFWALSLTNGADGDAHHGDDPLVHLSVDRAEADGILAPLASTYSPDNRAVYDGVSREGVRLVSFAPILKQEVFPLAPILRELLEIGERATSSPVEIEFAVRLSVKRGEPKEFAFLQLRPLSPNRELDVVEIDAASRDELICWSTCALGNGRIDTIHDALVVGRDAFDRARSRETAKQVARFNAELMARGDPYLLVGVGRWGSSHPEFGIPVHWNDIAGARAIIEAGFKDLQVTPSQGSHFFQNLAAFNIGYFTVNEEQGQGFVDWDWLAAQPAVETRGAVRHIRFERPIDVVMNGRTQHGAVKKPVQE